jgi:hypothetical protein
MTAKVDDPQKKSEQMALDFRKAWKKDMLSKKRDTMAEVRAENDRVEKFIELHERRLYGPKEEADAPELENLEQPAEEEKKQHKGHLRP